MSNQPLKIGFDADLTIRNAAANKAALVERLQVERSVSEATIDSRIIVIELDLDGEPTLIGIRTDRVYEVTTLARTASEPPPSVGMRWRADYIDCLVKRGGEFVIVPNLNAIFVSQRDRSAAANG